MQLLINDRDANRSIVESFLREICSEELKPQINELLSAEDPDWGALELLMAPFYNVTE